MGVIYKVENTLNNKVYIGKTTRNIEIRWKEHLACSATKDNKFYRALRKYPPSVFKLSIIEKASNDELNNLETYWINQYDSFRNGYNSTMGGDGTLKTDYDKIYQLWDQYLTYDEIAKITGYPHTTIRHILNGYENYSTFDARSRNNPKRKSVKQYTLDGVFVQSYKSLSDAARTTGLSVSMIYSCCEKIRLSGGGFQWRYANDIPPSKYTYRLTKSVIQLTINNEYVNSYNSPQEASDKTKVARDGIYKCCNGRIKSSGGYRWKYSDNSGVANNVV